LPELLKSTRSLTGQYLSGRKQIEIPPRRPVTADVSRRKANPQISQSRLAAAATLRISNATRHNLNNVSVEIPLEPPRAITGVSGSGKSTLVRDVLLPRSKPEVAKPKFNHRQSLRPFGF
jgi:excinuclease ABC subunit A